MSLIVINEDKYTRTQCYSSPHPTVDYNLLSWKFCVKTVKYLLEPPPYHPPSILPLSTTTYHPPSILPHSTTTSSFTHPRSHLIYFNSQGSHISSIIHTTITNTSNDSQHLLKHRNHKLHIINLIINPINILKSKTVVHLNSSGEYVH